MKEKLINLLSVIIVSFLLLGVVEVSKIHTASVLVQEVRAEVQKEMEILHKRIDPQFWPFRK